MIWLVMSIAVAILYAVKTLFIKDLSEDTDVYIIAFLSGVIALIVLIPATIITGIPIITIDFFLVLLPISIFAVIASVMSVDAFKHSDMSVVTPMVSFTPVFVIFVAFFLLGEMPSMFGIVGIIMIVIGSYFLRISDSSGGIFGPWRALLKERGPKIMLIVAIIYSITSPLDKMGALLSSPTFWTSCVIIMVSIFMSPMVVNSIKRSREDDKKVVPRPLNLLGLGIVNGVMLALQITVITMAFVAYVISIKRAGIVLSVIFGCIILKESSLRSKLVGVSIMILGVILISMF